MQSPLLNIFALFFSNSHGHIPAGVPCLGPAQRREGSFKYVNLGVLPSLPTSTCPGSLGVTSTFVLGGMQWERGFLPTAEGLSDWIATLCPSIVTDKPSASAILSLFLCGERRFSTAGDRRFLTLQTKPARKNLFDTQAAKMSHSIYSQSSVCPKYRIPESIKEASNQSMVPLTAIKDRHPQITLPSGFAAR